MRPVRSRANRFLVHSAEEKNWLRELLGADTRIEVVQMPAFTEISGRRWKSDEAKARLGVDRPMLLFFCFVREYKGLHDLIDALPENPEVARRPPLYRRRILGGPCRLCEPYRAPGGCKEMW